MPASAREASATSLTWLSGSSPADEITVTLSPPRSAVRPAASCERPALWTQTNSTVGLALVMTRPPGGELLVALGSWCSRTQAWVAIWTASQGEPSGGV